MALKGNLRDFSITQLLNLVNLAHKTGLLNLEAPGDTAQVSFREGKLAYARVGAEDNSLAAILHRAHKISNAQVEICLVGCIPVYSRGDFRRSHLRGGTAEPGWDSGNSGSSW